MHVRKYSKSEKLVRGHSFLELEKLHRTLFPKEVTDPLLRIFGLLMSSGTVNSMGNNFSSKKFVDVYG